MMKINSSGILYVVSTPIGNLKDISFRAVDVLKSVGCIIAEDTRHSHALLQHFSVTTKVENLHAFNEKEKSGVLIARLLAGETFALISDAGTPLISDPGFSLVRAAHQAQIKVVPVPGACAVTAALSSCGLPTDRFVFEGFLPAKNAARLTRLKALLDEQRSMVFYEAPHRIVDFFNALQEVFPLNREVTFCRELTKLFETIKTGTLEEVFQFILADHNQQKGEMVVVLAGKQIDTNNTDPAANTLGLLLAELPLKQAVELAAKLTGIKKNKLYQLALQLKSTH